MQRWGFIYTLGPDGTDVRFDTVGSPGCELVAVGVPTVEAAPAVVEPLLDRGVELIELCGAFGPAATEAVQRAAAGRVPVGAVTYPGSEAGALHRLFG